jgi:hypothetical protein
VRVAVAIAFVLAVALYAVHIESRQHERSAAAAEAYAALNQGRAGQALVRVSDTIKSLGETPELTRGAWSALMAGGGRQGRAVLLRDTFPYRLHNNIFEFYLAFSNDGRFLAAIDGPTITVWNVVDGTRVANATAGDRFVGFFRVGPRFFGLLASHQYYDLVSDVISLPENYRYAQPAKDALTAVAPGGDWAYRLPEPADGRTEYPVMLVNLHTGEKREVDVGYLGFGALGVDEDATHIALSPANQLDASHIDLWGARSRLQIARLPIANDAIYQLYFSSALNALIAVSVPQPVLLNAPAGLRLPHVAFDLRFYDPERGLPLFRVATSKEQILAVADDRQGQWFATRTADSIRVYRGPNSPWIATIAEREVNRAPATSR